MTTPSPRGAKHTCVSCHTKFYDLNKKDPACPQCEQVVVPVVIKTRAKRKSRE